ncbi:MAG: elongation factor G [bacterium]
MKECTSENIRNIVLVGQASSGKTSLAEAILYNCGGSNRLGKVDEGSSNFDYLPEETQRMTTITSKVCACEYDDIKINVIDTPGYADFTGELNSALRVVNNVIIICDSTTEVSLQNERIWNLVKSEASSRLIFVNKIGRDGSNFFKIIESAAKTFKERVIPLQIPIGEGSSFNGVIDLLNMKANIPEALSDQANKYREKLVEALAETDDALIEKYLEGKELSQEELSNALSKSIQSGLFIPVMCGSALNNTGVKLLTDLIISSMLSPVVDGTVSGKKPNTDEAVERKANDSDPFSALVFKTVSEPHLGELSFFRIYSGTVSSSSDVYNSSRMEKERLGQIVQMQGKNKIDVNKLHTGDIGIVAKLKNTKTGDTLCDHGNPIVFSPLKFPLSIISFAIKPEARKDEDKIGTALTRLKEEDPTLGVEVDKEFGQTIISGLGELHLEVIVSKLAKKFGVNVSMEKPRIPYRETIRKSAKGHTKYKKQSGGRGQYAEVYIEVGPLETGKGFEFVNKIVGGAIPAKFISSVEKGLKQAIQKGVIAGYPVVDLSISLYDGTFHTVDSSDIAFQIAASMAFKDAMTAANPVLMEPIMEIEVTIPSQYMGDVNGDLNSRRGRIIGIDTDENTQTIKANVPLAELYKYATDLKSMTQGSGTYSMQFSHYEQVPAQIGTKVVEETEKMKKG